MLNIRVLIVLHYLKVFEMANALSHANYCIDEIYLFFFHDVQATRLRVFFGELGTMNIGKC